MLIQKQIWEIKDISLKDSKKDLPQPLSSSPPFTTSRRTKVADKMGATAAENVDLGANFQLKARRLNMEKYFTEDELRG